MKPAKKIALLVIASVIMAPVFGQRLTPYQGSRIFWDINSRTTIFASGQYARMIELRDGRLLVVADGYEAGTGVAFSNDQGKNWSSPTRLLPPDNISYVNSEVFQLNNGTILVGVNTRPKQPYSVDRRFGIRVIRSIDNGATWSDPVFVYDAQHLFTAGCWEPAFLELPSGELQCYFADESENEYSYHTDQKILMCRSYDKGLTWSKPIIISYRPGSRDGMPVPLLLQDKSEIVVIIEDNGWPGRESFTVTTVRNKLDDNWTKGYVDAESPLREIIFQTIPSVGIYSAAPYIRQLPWGETVASFQSNENRPSNDLVNDADMHVLVGDEHAKNFKAKSAPFSFDHNQKASWTSISVIDTGIVVALASIGPPFKRNHIEMIKGYPVRQANAAYGSIKVDGIKTAGEKWTTPNAAQLRMGHVTKNRSYIDFLYDDKYLYITARVIDRDFINTGTDNDGVRFFIDADDVSGSTPQIGMYSFFFDTNGTVKFQRVENDTWRTDYNISDILYAIDIQSLYYNIEAAIPWSLLGKTAPPVNERMAIAIEIVNKKQDSIITEAIPDVDNNASWTWLEFRLVPNMK